MAQICGHGFHQGGWATVLYPGLPWGLGRPPPSALPGSSPSRIQEYPQDEGLGDKDSKVESRA